MTGRGIDQVMPEPLPPQLHEPWVKDARDYVRLAEQASGPIPRPVAPVYPWGDALAAIERLAPDLHIVNLETAVTARGTPWPGKGIHYRMNPAHVGGLAAARVNACTLANNHVLDWDRPGLADTLAALHEAGIATAGAGADAQSAQAAVALPLPPAPPLPRTSGVSGRVLLSAWATPGSGVPASWAAGRDRAGVALLSRLDETDAQTVQAAVNAQRRPGDRVVVSLHWGDNWVESVPHTHRWFARRLIDLGIADVVHGHSSHHPLPVERHAGKLILYGCGDLINDYEGITPHGTLRSDIGCLYLLTLGRADGRLRELRVLPWRLQRFRLGRPDALALHWLQQQFESGDPATAPCIEVDRDGVWHLGWADPV